MVRSSCSLRRYTASSRSFSASLIPRTPTAPFFFSGTSVAANRRNIPFSVCSTMLSVSLTGPTKSNVSPSRSLVTAVVRLATSNSMPSTCFSIPLLLANNSLRPIRFPRLVR